MKEKKGFTESYNEWRLKVHKWADEHYYLGFPVRKPTLFLLILFVLVFAVCSFANIVSRNKNDDDSSLHVPEISIQEAVFNYDLQKVFTYSSLDDFYYLASDNSSGNSDIYMEDFGVDYQFACYGVSFDSSYLYESLASNNVSCRYTLHWSNVTIRNLAIQFIGDFVSPYHVALSINGVDYDFYLNYNFPFVDIGAYTSNLRDVSLTFWCNGNDCPTYLVAVDSRSISTAIDDNYYAERIKEIKDEAYKQGFYAGKEEGYNLGYNADTTLTTLFWSVIDEPFAIIYRLLNFEVLGVNIFAFVSGLVTIGLIGFVIKLII